MNKALPNTQQNLAIRLLRLLRYNKVRSERAVELLPEDKRPLFHILPFLVHVNHPELPGFVDSPDVPYGLNNYSKRNQLDESLVSVFPDKAELVSDMKKIWPKEKKIDSLLLMGSIGTIAQSGKSDFDYWVCVDGQKLDNQALKLLQQKLEAIESWAWLYHQLEVHFFLSEIDKVRQNDFGQADGESAGSAQALFLKAEFYTTHIVVAGKAPFWWLMNDSANDEQYHQMIGQLKEGESPDPNWFMDLGNLTNLDPGELFGAAIWQIVKAMDSPFKSVLKMAKLEVFLHNIEHGKPLCNVLRKMVHNGALAPGGLEHVDPYALMFDELIEHYQATDQQEIVRLLRLCLYIKCDCKLSTPPKKGEQTFKRTIIKSYVAQWGWSKGTINRIDRIKLWDFHEKSKLSRQVHSFLINCYRRISAKLEDFEQQVSQQDMTVIGRKIEAFYVKKNYKIHYLRSVFDNELYCKTVTIKAESKLGGDVKTWHLLSGDHTRSRKEDRDRDHLSSSTSLIQLIAWATWNRLMDSETRILLDYNTEPVTDGDVKKLAEQLHTLFGPVKVGDLSRDELLVPSKTLNCLVVLNFEERRTSSDIKSAIVVYSTSWGELYVKSGLDAARDLKYDLMHVSPKPGCYLLAPDESHKRRLYDEFEHRTEMEFDHLL